MCKIKLHTLCIICLGIVLTITVGCEKKQSPSQQSSSSSSSDTVNQPTVQTKKRVEIPLDSSIPDAKAETTMNLYVILDGSGSMDGNVDDEQYSDKLESAKAAVEKFIQNVPMDINLGLYVFDSDGTREVVPLAPNNRVRFLEAVKQVRSGGNTPLGRSIHNGIQALIQQYKKQLGYGNFRLVVVTDGDSSDDIIGPTQEAMEYGFPIYTIGFYMDNDHPLKQYSVSYKAANDSRALQEGLTETLAETETFDPTEFEGLQ